MKLYFIRHGETESNRIHRYLGRTDEGLSERGAAAVRAAGCFPGVSEVFVSGLCRSAHTARILFPNADQIVDAGLNEMDFGDFEYRLFSELADDPDYRAWVESGCLLPCRNGEDIQSFSDRVNEAFLKRLRAAEKSRRERMIFVTHSGVIMALMHRYAGSDRPFYEWYVQNVTGYEAEINLRAGEAPTHFANYREMSHLSF